MEIGWTTKCNSPEDKSVRVCFTSRSLFSINVCSGYIRLFLSAVNLIKPRLTHQGRRGWREERKREGRVGEGASALGRGFQSMSRPSSCHENSRYVVVLMRRGQAGLRTTRGGGKEEEGGKN